MSLQLTVLGSGSAGNSTLIEAPGIKILVDAGLSAQQIKKRLESLGRDVDAIDAVLVTHEHADHIFGLDDLRLFPFRLGHPVPLYCQKAVEARIRKSFDYAFVKREQTHPGSRPQLEFCEINHDPFELLGEDITPIPMKHGPYFNVLGFRIGDFAYCTDTNEIPEESMARLEGVSTLVVGALRDRPHPTHFSLGEALAVAERLRPKQTYLTHLSHEFDHQPTCDRLPDGVDLAYDTLQVDVQLPD